MDAITLDRLFRVRKETSVGQVKLWVRALSDFEMNVRHRQATKESLDATKRLADTESVEYQTYYLPLAEMDEPSLRVLLQSYQRREFTAQAEREILLEYIPFPDEASDDEERDVQDRREQAEKALPDRRKEFVTKKMDAFKTAIESKDRTWLESELKSQIKSSVSDAAYGERYVYETLLVQVETEDGKPYFRDLAEVRGLNRAVIDHLMAEGRSVNDLDPLALSTPSATG